MIAKIDLIKLGRNCAVAITETGGTNTLTYVEDSSKIEVGYNQNNNTVTVTISGTTSATTKDITTGTYLTMDIGTGAVTITDYATFKTNYALLFLNGGSATIPTLDEVLTAGNTGIDKTIIINYSTGTNYSYYNSAQIHFFDVGTGSNASYSYLKSNELLFQINVSEYQTRLKPNLYEVNLDITNYLPQSSGTLLNGNFNENNLGLYLNYNDNIYTLGDDNTAEGLKIDNLNKVYKLGDDGNNGLFINNTAQSYFLGDNYNTKGVSIDIPTDYYILGNTSGTNIQINGVGDNMSFITNNLTFYGTNLLTTSGGNNTSQHLIVNINGQQYKIQLRQ